MSSRPLFRFPPEQKTKATPFSPPSTSVSSDGLFSAQSTPQADRYRGPPSSNSLFAGATPGARSGGGGLFGGSNAFSIGTTGNGSDRQQPLFSQDALGLSPPRVTRPTAALGRYSSPLSEDEEEGYTDDGSPRIYEDDSHDNSTIQDDDDDTGVYGDEEDFGEDDTMQDDSRLSDNPLPYEEDVGAPAAEPGSLIIRTETLMEELADVISPPSDDDDYYDDDDMDVDRPMPPSLERQQEHLNETSKAFLISLQEHLPKTKKTKADTDLHNAYYIASLVLPLNHSTANTTEVLRKWLFTHHASPSRAQLTSVRGTHPNSAFSVDFWDVVFRLTLRGEVQEAMEVIRSANWDLRCQDAPAVSKPAFGTHQINDKRYTRAEIDSIKDAVSTFLGLLARCPGKGRSSYQPPFLFFPLINLDVDSPGSPADWRIWRGEVIKASEELKGIAQVDETTDDDTEDSYYASFNPVIGRGITRARKFKAKVPTEISRELRKIYEVMRGEKDAILTESDIWQEAVVGLMMWVKDVDSVAAEEEDEFEDSINVNHMGPGEYYTVLAYRKRRQLAQLTSVLEIIADELPLNPTETLEIAAGGAMAGDPTFIAEIAKYSQLVAATVVEIGGWAGWIKRETSPKDPSSGKDMGLDEDDFAVLAMRSAGASEAEEQAKLAEDTLRRYASSLFGTAWVNEDAEIEGWEIGVGLLNRIKDGKKLAGKLLALLPLTSTPRVEKLLSHTNESRLPEAASGIAYKWAQHLQATTQNYGDILHFLSLSAPLNEDARAKLHDTTTDLLRRSLLGSSSFPAQEALDPRLKHLLSSPSECPSEILRFELSGYAALRTFYALRENAPETAVRALTAVIRAAGEPIDGGVWDHEWESPVEPTVLPAVLRELLTCVNALGTQDALDVCKVLTDWEGCGKSLRKASVEVGPEGSWVDLGREADVVRRVREKLCGVLARGWVKGGE